MPLLAVTKVVTPSDGGWLLLLGAGAELVALSTVAARGVRARLSWLAPVGAALSTGGASGVLLVGGLPPDPGRRGTVLLVVLVAVLLSLPLVLPFGGCWLVGHAVRRRRQKQLDREEGAVATAAAQAELRARDERARVAAGLRAAVLDHAARVPKAAEEADPGAVLDAARQALAAMRGLLDGLGNRAVVPRTGVEVPSWQSV